MARVFTLLVRNRKGRWLAYPQTDGPVTIRTAERLHSRGFEVKGRTVSNGITETLTLKEMKESILP